MIRGRKVTDPIVQGAASSYDTKPGLTKAWDTVGKAKSELRKAEQRLEEAERLVLPPQLNLTGETSITDYGGLGVNTDHNETFNIADEYASGVVVDNYGRSAYLMSKTQAARKVSRLDDKYIEDCDKERRKKSSTSSKHNENHVPHPGKKRQANLQLQEKKYEREPHRSHIGSRSARSVNDRHVEFSDHVHYRDNRVGLGNGYMDVNHRDTLPSDQSTLTNSRDIRETEINFLNNNLTRDYESHLGYDTGTRLTHVSVTVPGTSRPTTASSGYSSAGTQKTGSSKKSHFLDLVSESPEMDGRTSDCSQSDSESGKGRRFKGNIKHIGPDGLAKIKETIRKQQNKSSAPPRENNEDIAGATGEEPLEPAGPSHRLHDASEPIMPRSQDLIEGAEKTAKVRKIAAGPATPSYKGFSEAEVKYRIVENKGSKFQDGGRKDKKRQVSLKVQDKRIDPVGTWLTVEEGDGKTKKVTRVIAPSRKPVKQQPQPKNKEIITTSSWRAGQELILRELGPMKKKHGRNKEYDLNRNEASSPNEERPETQGGEVYLRTGVVSATAAEIQHHNALSEEARKVYNDLYLDDEEARKRSSEREKRWKAPVKRKAPKITETEKHQQPSAKQRHYDQEQIRKYMQRQKADRVRRQKEEDTRMKEEDEARKRQLEDLYNKQKHVSHVSAAAGKKEKSRQRQTFDSIQTVSLGDLPRHHPYHTDRARFLVSSDSEFKENHDDEDMEMSDSSSTITGDCSEDNSPNSSPRRNKMEATSNTRQNFTSKEVLKVNKANTNSQQRVENESSNIRTYGDFTFDVGGVTTKFSQALQEKLNEEPPSLAGTYGSMNSQEHYIGDSNRHNDGLPRSRADRIQAIKDTAATLQNRLKEEARKIHAQSSTSNKIENGATSRPTVRWNDTDSPRRDREEEFMSRYDRVTAANDDYSVFKTNLPGSQPQVRQPETSVPVASQSKLASGTTANDIGEDTTITETSTFSEITLTDESDDEDLTGRKIGTGLRKADFHVGSSGQTNANKTATQLHIPRPTHPVTHKASNAWDDPQPDEFNVFSIYSRRQERMIRPGREPMSRKKSSEPEYQAATAQSTATAPVKSSSSHQKSAPSAVRSRSPGLSARRSESPFSQNSESLRTHSPVERTRSKPSKLTVKSAEHYDDDEEDTIEEESYTNSFESDEKTVTRAKSVSEKLLHSHKSMSASIKLQTKISDRVSPQMESSMDEDISQEDVTPPAERIVSDSETTGPPRLSPNSLERKFYTEFHNLESMELSLKQLTSVDRTRAVSMAQQETVSLAQMLKAKQQGYDLQLKEIQLKAQIEATEATKQLEDARKRASDAAINADMIAKVRGEGVSAIQESTRRLIDTQTEAAKATAEAAKFLSEPRALGLQDTNTLAAETTAASAVNTALENNWQGGKSTAKLSKSTKRRSDEAQDHEDSESVGSVDDFSINESMTEDEREEKSFRLILPSESHRKKGKHVHSDNESVASEASSTKLLEHDIHTLFKEGSFDKFTEDMVRQFMKEEALRSQHQQSLLKLRENALMEKTKAELQWLEQQRQRIRNKGADDSYPQIKKRQRGLKMKLQEQQEEIRRMREENKAAAKERQLKLYEEITKRQASQSKPETSAPPRGRLGRPNEVHTEAEVSSIDEASDAEKQRKDYKSDSEIYTDLKSSGRRTKQDPEKYKKIHLDERYLTQRQSQLMDRRKNAEELLKWKSMLDKEEHRVFKLEKQALKVWREDKDGTREEPSLSAAKDDTEKASSKKDNGTTKDSTIKTVSMSQERDSTVISENVTTARDDSLYTSIKEDIKTASLESSPEEVHRRMMNDKSNIKNHSGSESSVIEDIQSQSSVEDSKKTNDSSDDTMTHSYGNETFEDTATGTASKKMSKSQSTSKSPLEKLKRYRGLSSPRGLFSSRSHSRNSESESEDSFSLNESQSELSDFEGRIRALNEELRKRKTEADKLKRERKKKKKELMKNKEETLKKQIEAYDNQIAQLKVDLQKEMTHEPAKTSVRPQIKQPKVSPSKTIRTPTKQRPETDSSGPDSTHVSPNIPEDEDQKQISPNSMTTPNIVTKAQLDRISEGSETPNSRSERSEPTYKEKVQSIKDLISGEYSSNIDDKTDEIEEDIISAASEPSDDKSKEIKINLKSKEDIYDVSVSYTDDFLTEQNTATQHDKLPLSARSLSQISDEVESRNVPLSAMSNTDQISEQISENLPSVSASESFIKQLDLKAQGNDIGDIFGNDRFEKENDSEGDISQRSSVVESSRPSSGRSERSSVLSYQTEHESSESEKSPALQQEDKVPNFEDDISEPSSKNRPFGPRSSNVLDIDDLIDFDNEEMTPVASPRGTPLDSSRHESTSERSDRPSNFFDPLGEFEIGDIVSVTGPSGERVLGTLLFKGNVQFAPGVWAGVELDSPEGRHNGMEDGVRYFTCRNRYGLIVPGHDMVTAHPGERDVAEVPDNVDVRSSIESVKSVTSVNTEDGDLLRFIDEADKNVQMFDESPQPSPRVPEHDERVDAKSRNELLADRITNDLFESVIRENVGTISRIADRKQTSQKKGPPVAPKPDRTKLVEEPQINGDIDDLEDFLHLEQGPDITPPLQNEQNIDETTDITVSNMMNDAIEHMLIIRRNNRPSQDVNQSRDSGILDAEDDHNEGPTSPTDEILGVLDRADDDLQLDTPLRPGSPVPGLQSDKDSHKPVTDSGLFEGDYEDELWEPPSKAPPPYPDLRTDIPRSDLKKFAEEVFYAVPHEEKEIDSIVSGAVNEFWEQRRYGEPLTDLQPSEAFYTHEEIGSDLISNSRRVFKKLLFDLSGEIIRNIYKEDEYDSPVAWHKPKRKTNKYYRGTSPPRTIDVLKPVVQEAVIDILGLNGAKKSEKSKWGIRKKKDLVDTILVQELREEEPEWVNYDDDELAVKMQLTETIFNDLLTDTVQTMNRIVRRKQSLQQQKQAAV